MNAMSDSVDRPTQMYVQVAFHHPLDGPIDRFIVAEDLTDLARQLRLESNIQLTADETTVYAALEDDLLADIGQIVNNTFEDEE